MNRQVVAFLSMFSLVLVLSIYYVMLPTRSASGNENSNPVGNIITNANDPYFESIILERTSYHEQFINAQYEIVASSEYSNAEKVIALELIENERMIMKQESDLRGVIVGIGYPTAYVEVEKDLIVVLTVSETKTLMEVATIIYEVQDFLEIEPQVYVSFR